MAFGYVSCLVLIDLSLLASISSEAVTLQTSTVFYHLLHAVFGAAVLSEFFNATATCFGGRLICCVS